MIHNFFYILHVQADSRTLLIFVCVCILATTNLSLSPIRGNYELYRCIDLASLALIIGNMFDHC